MNRIQRVLHATLLATSIGVMIATHAAVLKIDSANSSVSAAFKQINLPIEDKFKKFTAVIDYDAAKPNAAKASVDIDTASLDLGDAEYSNGNFPFTEA